MSLRRAGREALRRNLGRMTRFTHGNVSARWYEGWEHVPRGRMDPGAHRWPNMAPGLPVYVVFSYGTPVAMAWRRPIGPEWVVTDQRYSPTTTGHVSAIAATLAVLGWLGA